MGKYNEKKDIVTEVATLQSVPMKQGGVQMMLMPYGMPFENILGGEIEGKHIIYRYSEAPQELKDKYMEISEKISKNGGLGQLQFGTKDTTNIKK